MQFWVTVAAWEQGVLVRLGKHTHHLAPGVHWRIPFLDRVVIAGVRERVVCSPNGTVTSQDGQAFTFGFSLRFSIVDLRKMVETVARPAEVLESTALAAGASLISSSSAAELSADNVATAAGAAIDGPRMGLSVVEAHVVTFAKCRTLRLLQAEDDKYSGALDQQLDEAPCKII